MLNIILFGPPGAGKGTQSQKIIKKYNLKHISTGDALRREIKAKTLLGIEAQKLIDDGNYVTDEMAFERTSTRRETKVLIDHSMIKKEAVSVTNPARSASAQRCMASKVWSSKNVAIPLSTAKIGDVLRAISRGVLLLITTQIYSLHL